MDSFFSDLSYCGFSRHTEYSEKKGRSHFWISIYGLYDKMNKNPKEHKNMKWKALETKHQERNISGNRIREYRKHSGLSQEELATRIQLKGIDLNQKAISRIEGGKRIVTDYEVVVFAEIFHVEVKDLLTRILMSE